MTQTTAKEIASHELNAKGILVVRVLTGETNTVEAARHSVSVLTKLSGGVRRPLLVDLTEAKNLDAEARQLYVQSAPAYATRVALLSKSLLTRVIGNFFIAVMAASSEALPSRMFADEPEAVEWLLK